jgi:HSF-type DNA-binding
MKKPDSPGECKDKKTKSSGSSEDETAQTVSSILEIDPRTTVPSHFPSQVHEMITEIEELASSDKTMKQLRKIICWQGHGMAFKIHDRKKFIEKVMPRYFSRLKYASWVRQLNLYGFKRIQRDGDDKGALYHEKFLRGLPMLAATMTKVKKSKTPPRPSDDLEKEPNFEQMVYLPVGVPLEQVLKRHPNHAQPKAKQTNSERESPAPAPDPAPTPAPPVSSPNPSLDQDSTHDTAPPAPSPTLLASSTRNIMSESSLRDMLLPVLNTNGDSPNDSQQGGYDPFETLWSRLDEDLQSTAHNGERLSLSSSPNLRRASMDSTSMGGLDVEPLRVFHPDHQHANTDHEQSEQEGETKKSNFAPGA